MLVARHNFLATLTSWKQCKCEEEASPGETSPSGTLSTSILLEPEAAPMSTTLAKELNISTRSILVFLETSESFLKRLLFKARASRRAACSFFLLMMLSIITAARFSYVLLLPRCLSDWTLSWKRRCCFAWIFTKDYVCISHNWVKYLRCVSIRKYAGMREIKIDVTWWWLTLSLVKLFAPLPKTRREADLGTQFRVLLMKSIV